MTNETDLVTQQIQAHDEAAKPLIKTAKPFARPLAEILSDLSKPIAPQISAMPVSVTTVACSGTQ